jgi:hypothetical protein
MCSFWNVFGLSIVALWNFWWYHLAWYASSHWVLVNVETQSWTRNTHVGFSYFSFTLVWNFSIISYVKPVTNFVLCFLQALGTVWDTLGNFFSKDWRSCRRRRYLKKHLSVINFKFYSLFGEIMVCFQSLSFVNVETQLRTRNTHVLIILE